MKEQKTEKKLLTVKELCEYTGWCETSIRKLLKNPDSKFTIRFGNRLYADKKLFDDYIEHCAKYQIKI